MFQTKRKETTRNTDNAKCSINKGFSRKFVFHIFSTMLHVFQRIVAIYSSKKPRVVAIIIMATLYQRLSTKVQARTNLSEVLITLKNGNDYFVRGKSGIFVTKDNFKNGGIVVNRRKIGNDVEYHEQQLAKMIQLEIYIMNAVNNERKESIDSAWLKNVVYTFHHGDKNYKAKDMLERMIDEYLSHKDFSTSYLRSVKVMYRDLVRFERYKQLSENKKYKFNPHTVTHRDVEEFTYYLRHEYEFAKKDKQLFKQLTSISSRNIKHGKNCIFPRGENSIISIVKKLKSFFIWMNNTERIDNNPFKSFLIGSAHYGTPYYITIDERNIIADYPYSSEHLMKQRDVFVFQCLVGCRVSDLIRLTESNIVDDMLIYAPHKTKDDGAQTLLARVPLHTKAKEIIEKYKGVLKDKRLLPCISPQKYNVAIKELFTIAGITRSVTVRNPLTGEPEQRPLNEIASSHIARRTFVGNAYAQVRDPNLIGKMSGHVEGSAAFARYRKIEDETLRDIINKL